MNARPLFDRIIVRPVASAEMQGGLYIPETARDRPQEGVVVAVGDGRREHGELVPPTVKAGERVLFGKFSGANITINNEELLIMREEEILAVLE